MYHNALLSKASVAHNTVLCIGIARNCKQCLTIRHRRRGAAAAVKVVLSVLPAADGTLVVAPRLPSSLLVPPTSPPSYESYYRFNGNPYY